MSDGLPVDPLALREEVKSKYRAVAADSVGGAVGESKARLFEVFGYAFLAHKQK